MPIYFIQQGNDGPIKIGLSTDIQRRWFELQQVSDLPLSVLGIVDGHRHTEHLLHGRFSQDKVYGEWFAPSPELIEYIQENVRTFEIDRNYKFIPTRPNPPKPYTENAKSSIGLKILIKPYLETLKLSKDRDKVPTISELAAAAGMHVNSYRRLAQNETGKIDKDAIAKTIAELRRRGFDTQVGDVLVYVPD